MRVETAMNDEFAFERLVGDSPWTARTLRRILQAASYSYPVLIQGPAGSGKELIARAIHRHSPRSSQPFIPFRSASARGPLGLAQLFGQVAGAFAWMPSATMGSCQAADGGTLLLDEVGDLDAEAQQRLLEFVTTKCVRPVGGDARRAINVRIIATSSRDLREEVREKRFRFELLYRLQALSLETLPLSERREDIAPIVRHIIARVTLENGLGLRHLTPAAMALLETRSWPGNVAELQAVVERTLLASPHRELLDVEAVTEWLDPVVTSSSHLASDEAVGTVGGRPMNAYESLPAWQVVDHEWPTLAEITAKHLRATLDAARQDLAVAARLLRVTPEELQRLLTEQGLVLPGQLASQPDPSQSNS